MFVPPPMPRSRQLGSERQDRLSMTAALGTGAQHFVHEHVYTGKYIP
jgi:hypothetical protein